MRLFFVLMELMLIVAVSLLYYFASPIQTERQIKIPKGSIQKIVTDLQKRDIPLSELDVYLLRFLGSPQSGWIDLGATELSRADFLYRLTKAKAALFAVKIIPGETTVKFLETVSKRHNLPYEELVVAYNRYAPYPDGVFFAETYFLPVGIDAEHLVRYLIRKGIQRHRRLAQKVFGSYNERKWFTKVVTIASIIQKEAASRDEMPIIAGVIYNRLKKGMPLQMDGALNYGVYSHRKITPRRIREDRSRFNTYLHRGLPPHPVCIVGKDAILAALKPAKVPYLYFVRGVDGKHIFSKTYSEHLRHIENVRKRNKK